MTVIQLKEHINKCSSLCVFNEQSFIYVYYGMFFQISSEDSSILFQSKEAKGDGWYGVLPLEEGKCFVVNNYKKISFIKPCYA